MWVLQTIETIGRTIWAFVEALFSLLPFYRQLSDLKSQVIATAIGVPVVVITIVGALITIVRFFWRHSVNA